MIKKWNIQEQEALGFPSFFQIHSIGWSLQVFEDGLEETPIIKGSNEIKYAGTPSWYDFSILGDYILNKNIKLNFGIYNLFDFHYREFGSGISAPGRNFQIGLNWEP